MSVDENTTSGGGERVNDVAGINDLGIDDKSFDTTSSGCEFDGSQPSVNNNQPHSIVNNVQDPGDQFLVNNSIDDPDDITFNITQDINISNIASIFDNDQQSVNGEGDNVNNSLNTTDLVNMSEADFMVEVIRRRKLRQAELDADEAPAAANQFTEMTTDNKVDAEADKENVPVNEASDESMFTPASLKKADTALYKHKALAVPNETPTLNSSNIKPSSLYDDNEAVVDEVKDGSADSRSDSGLDNYVGTRSGSDISSVVSLNGMSNVAAAKEKLAAIQDGDSKVDTSNMSGSDSDNVLPEARSHGHGRNLFGLPLPLVLILFTSCILSNCVLYCQNHSVANLEATNKKLKTEMNELQQLNKEMEGELVNLTIGHAQEIEQLNANHISTVQQMTTAHTNEMEQLNTAYFKDIEKLKDDLHQSNLTIEKQESKIKDMTNEADVHLKRNVDLQLTHSHEMEKKEQKIEKILHMYDTFREEKIERMRSDLLTSHNRDLEKLQSACEESAKRAEESHAAELNKVRAEASSWPKIWSRLLFEPHHPSKETQRPLSKETRPLEENQ